MGGGERADSVLAALQALPATVSEDHWVLVHDAARPSLRGDDLTACIAAAEAATDRRDPRRAGARHPQARRRRRRASPATEPRERLWRALTPQTVPPRRPDARAGSARADGGVAVTDEAMAMERSGLQPRLVEGREDNIKVTTPADLALAEFMLRAR